MDMKNLICTALLSLAASSAALFTLFAQEDPAHTLSANTKIAFYGDNITEMRGYTKYVNLYLNACSGIPGIQIFVSSYNGEKAEGFAKRMERDVTFWKADAVFLHYGLTDGVSGTSGNKYESDFTAYLTQIVQFCKNMNSRIILMSPLELDETLYRKNIKGFAKKTNASLKKISSLAYETALKEKVSSLDIHTLFHEYAIKGHQAFGEKYNISGGDGMHPGYNGHLLITYAILKKLNVDGRIADIRLNMTGSGSTVSAGHTIKAEKPGTLEIISTRYPYCFGKRTAKNKGETGDIYNMLEILPFQNELNQFKLTVLGLKTPKASVAWGKYKKDFTKEELEKGINLAAVFPENPLQDAFFKVAAAVQEKQDFDAALIHTFVQNQLLAKRLNLSEAGNEAFKTVIAELKKTHDFYEKKVADQVKPVTHTITITEIK